MMWLGWFNKSVACIPFMEWWYLPSLWGLDRSARPWQQRLRQGLATVPYDLKGLLGQRMIATLTVAERRKFAWMAVRTCYKDGTLANVQTVRDYCEASVPRLTTLGLVKVGHATGRAPGAGGSVGQEGSGAARRARLLAHEAQGRDETEAVFGVPKLSRRALGHCDPVWPRVRCRVHPTMSSERESTWKYESILTFQPAWCLACGDSLVGKGPAENVPEAASPFWRIVVFKRSAHPRFNRAGVHR